MKFKVGDYVSANDGWGVKIRDGVVVAVNEGEKFPYFVKNRNILDDLGFKYSESEMTAWVPGADDE